MVWTNYGSAAAFEHWVPGYELVDFSGAVVRTLPATVNLRTLVHDESRQSREEPVSASATESVQIHLTGLAPGHYTLRASVDWQQHKPGASHVVNYAPMALARDGRDDSGSYPIATLDIPRDVLTSFSGQSIAGGGHQRNPRFSGRWRECSNLPMRRDGSAKKGFVVWLGTTI